MAYEKAFETLLSTTFITEATATYGNDLYRILMSTTPKEWENIPGIGKRTIAKLQALRDILKGFQEERLHRRPSCSNPQEIVKLLSDMRDLEEEEIRVLYLDVKNGLQHMDIVNKGTINASQLDVRSVYSNAVRLKAASIIVVHNHPSGISDPSDSDKKVTKILYNAGKLLQIPLIDHIIIAAHSHYSFAEHNMLDDEE